MTNIEELDRALKWIEENPERHDQRTWARKTPCGTALCLAGAVAMLNGWMPLFAYGYEDEQTEIATDGLEGQRDSIQDVAIRLLELDEDDAETLFAGDNNLADLKRLRDELAEGW